MAAAIEVAGSGGAVIQAKPCFINSAIAVFVYNRFLGPFFDQLFDERL